MREVEGDFIGGDRLMESVVTRVSCYPTLAAKTRTRLGWGTLHFYCIISEVQQQVLRLR
jgi:hypothetical protein